MVNDDADDRKQKRMNIMLGPKLHASREESSY